MKEYKISYEDKGRGLQGIATVNADNEDEARELFRRNHSMGKASIKSVSESKGCFIATTVFEDPEHPYVVELRHYRDNTLNETIVGRFVVRMYYALAPKLLFLFNGEYAKKAMRRLLVWFVDRRRDC